MKDVEMAPLFAPRLSGDYLRRRQIEVARRKDVRQSGNVVVLEENNQIHIQSQTGFAVEDGGHAAGDDIADARLLERAHKQQEKVNFGHSRICAAPQPPPASPASRDVGRAVPRPSFSAPTSKGAP